MSERPSPVLQSIILAAGNGRRLRTELPKPLVSVGGEPLLARAIGQAAAAGCEEVVVVVGDGASRIRDFLEGLETPLRVRLVRNPSFDRPNGLSMLAAEGVAAERFFIQMADHVFARPVLGRLAACPGTRLLVDRDGSHLDPEDATKVETDGDRVVAIGKSLERWDAIDAGYFVADRRVFAALHEASRRRPPTLSDGMRALAERGDLGIVVLDGSDWVDVDTPRDREAAERLLVGEPLEAVAPGPSGAGAPPASV